MMNIVVYCTVLHYTLCIFFIQTSNKHIYIFLRYVFALILQDISCTTILRDMYWTPTHRTIYSAHDGALSHRPYTITDGAVNADNASFVGKSAAVSC